MSVSLTHNEKISLIGNLATLLAAGIPILESVNSILEDTKGSQKKVLEQLKADLMQGTQVAGSLAKFPGVFDKVSLNLIKASEEAGTLETTLKDLRIFIQREAEFLDKVKLALVYPALILVVFLGVVLMVLIVVVPKISLVFSRLRVELPLPTKILIFLSDVLLKQTVWLVGALALLVIGSWFIARHNKSFFTSLIFGLPGIRGLIRQIDFTRFSRSMYLLLSSGMPIVTSLDLAKDVVLGRQTAKLIDKSREMVAGGKRLSDGLRFYKGVVPVIMLKLVEAGERTGSLDKSMQEVSQHLDYEVENSLKTLMMLLEPILLVIVAVSVGMMMMAIIAPIYGLIGQVGGR